jgi:CSLREA domain-containing protein
VCRLLRPRDSAFLALGVLLTLLAGPSVARAATISVTTTTDNLSVNGDCSLREAIMAANTDAVVDSCGAGSGADTIILPAGPYTLSIPGGEDGNASGDLDITADLTISGAGAATAIVDGGALDRVFHLLGAITVNLSGLTIQNGSSGRGGGIFNAGGGTLAVTNSTISGNTSTDEGGGIANGSFVAAIPAGTLNLTNSTVSGNSAKYGGGIFHAPGATLTLDSSTVSGNSGTAHGGGIVNRGTMSVRNSTISGNTIAFGGGIINFGTATLTSSTLSGNTATFGAGGGGGIYADSAGSITLKNTIVANSPSGGNCTGGIGSLGHNLSSDASCGFTASGDLQNTNPQLGPLADNGGPTQTHALLAGSPAINAGSLDCPPPAADQRGVARPQGAACDIGAYEHQGATAVALRSMRATASSHGVVIRWRTGAEAGVLGFNVYRGKLRLNRRLIAALGAITGRAYAFRDTRGTLASRYWLEVMRIDGSRARFGPATVKRL